MARERSPQTEIRELKSTLKKAQDAYLETQRECYAAKARALKAETELAEWKQRFDALLARTPEIPRFEQSL